MSQLRLDVEVNASALQGLKSSVNALKEDFGALSAAIKRSGDKGAEEMLKGAQESFRKLTKESKDLATSVKQDAGDIAKAFSTLNPTLEKLALGLDRSASAMERLAERSGRAAQAQIKSHREVAAAAAQAGEAEGRAARQVMQALEQKQAAAGSDARKQLAARGQPYTLNRQQAMGARSLSADAEIHMAVESQDLAKITNLLKRLKHAEEMVAQGAAGTLSAGNKYGDIAARNGGADLASAITRLDGLRAKLLESTAQLKKAQAAESAHYTRLGTSQQRALDAHYTREGRAHLNSMYATISQSGAKPDRSGVGLMGAYQTALNTPKPDLSSERSAVEERKKLYKEQAEAAKKHARDSAQAIEVASQRQHAAIRGVAAGFDNMWLSYGKYALYTAGAYAAIAGVRKAFSEGMDQNYQLTFTKALSDNPTSFDTGKVIASLETQAKDSTASTLDLAKGLRVLQQAGVDASVGVNSINYAAKTALMGETDLKTATEGIAKSLEIFQMKSSDPAVLGQNIQHVADVAAKVSTDTVANLTDVYASFKNVGSAAQSFGLSLDFVGYAAKKMFAGGLKGAEAGTVFRNFSEEILGAGSRVAESYRKALKMDRFDGSKDDPVKYIEKLVEATKKLDFRGQQDIFKHLTDERARKFFRLMVEDTTKVSEGVDAFAKDSAGAIDRFTSHLNGDAKVEWMKATASIETSFAGATQESGAAIASLAKTVQEVFNDPAMRDSIQGFIGLLSEIGKVAAWQIGLIAQAEAAVTDLSNATVGRLQDGQSQAINQRFDPSNVLQTAQEKYSNTARLKSEFDQRTNGKDLNRRDQAQKERLERELKEQALDLETAKRVVANHKKGRDETALKMYSRAMPAITAAPEEKKVYGTNTLDLPDRKAAAAAERAAREADKLLEQELKRIEDRAKSRYETEAYAIQRGEKTLQAQRSAELISEVEFERQSDAFKQQAYQNKVKEVQESSAGYIAALQKAKTAEERAKIRTRMDADGNELAKARSEFERGTAGDAEDRGIARQATRARWAKESSSSQRAFSDKLEADAKNREFDRVDNPVDLAGLKARYEVELTYREKFRNLEEERKRAGASPENDAMYSGRLDALRTEYELNQKVAESRARTNALYDTSATAGFDRFMTSVKRKSADSGSAVEEGLNTALSRTSDYLGNLATGGAGKFRSFASSLLKDLARIAMQRALLNLIAGMFSSAGSSAAGSSTTGAATAAGVAHTGSIVGLNEGTTRQADLSLFHGAQRYHTGGIVADEVPIIAKRGEGVFTEGQMKRLAPAGGGGTVVINQYFTTTVQGGSGDDAGKKSGDAIAQQLMPQMKSMVLEVIADQKRYGGMLA